MKHPTLHSDARRGAIVPLTALVLVILLAMVAFAVDLGWIVLTQADLQSAADAAALAGAGPLMDGYVLYNLPGQTSTQKNSVLLTYKDNAKTAAKTYAQLNSAGSTSLTLNDSDIEFGFTDASGNYTTPASAFPNTIKVILRRDSSANGSLGLFFGPVIGKSTADLTATAASCIYAAEASSFKDVSNFKLGMLPMTYDVNWWANFRSTGLDPDGNKSTDASGNPTLSVYPSIKDTGNFGMLSLDDSHNGASTIAGWIDNGITQTEVKALLSSSASASTPLIPLSSHNQNLLPSAAADGYGSWNWNGNPGLKTSDIFALADHVGETYLLPLFKPYDSVNYEAGIGNGSHYTYNIVQFVSVKIISASNANKGGVVVQPSAMVLDFDQITFTSTPVPAGTGTTSSTSTFVAPKLVQ